MSSPAISAPPLNVGVYCQEQQSSQSLPGIVLTPENRRGNVLHCGFINETVKGPEYQYVQGPQSFCDVTAKAARDMPPVSKQFVAIMCSFKLKNVPQLFRPGLRGKLTTFIQTPGPFNRLPVSLPLRRLWRLERGPRQPGVGLPVREGNCGYLSTLMHVVRPSGLAMRRWHSAK